MKQYAVYGIGNALLDMVYEVSFDFLDALDLQKGVRTLIDEDTHHRLVKHLSGYTPVYACGGSAANSMITAQDLGVPTFFSCRVGADTAGGMFYQDLIAHGTDTNLTETNRAPDLITGKCIVLVTPDADRTMCTFLGAADQLPLSTVNETAIAASEYVYIEGYLTCSDIGNNAAINVRELAEKHDIKTSMTLSDPTIIDHFRENFHKIIGNNKLDLIFCNADEVKMFCNTNQLAVAELRLKKYAKQYLITRGKKGAIAFDGRESHAFPAYPSKLIDTVGAGDTFAGAFLYAINAGISFEQACNFANLAASEVVAKIGPRLEPHELDDLKQQVLRKSQTLELELI